MTPPADDQIEESTSEAAALAAALRGPLRDTAPSGDIPPRPVPLGLFGLTPEPTPEHEPAQ
jgi:hypothetical protein